MDVEEILQDLRIDYLRTGHHHCRPGWIQLDCPFCGLDSGRYHLGWNLVANYTNCWKCGGHHPEQVLIAFGLRRDKAKVLLSGVTGETPQEEKPRRTSLRLPNGVSELLPAHRRYLRGRGFNSKEMERIWGVRGIGIAPRLSWRLFIPIIHRDKVESWTTRSIGEKVTQRYISASAEEERTSHKHLIYGQDHCRHSIVIVEGPLDAWRVGPGAGALFGTAFTPSQVRRILEHPYRYIVFDSSSEAQERAEELAGQLCPFPGTTERITLDAEDPGSATEREIRRLRKVTRL